MVYSWGSDAVRSSEGLPNLRKFFVSLGILEAFHQLNLLQVVRFVMDVYNANVLSGHRQRKQ